MNISDLPPHSQTSQQRIESAIAQLNRSERGQQTLRDLKTMFCNGAHALDSQNQQALLTLTIEALSGTVDFESI